MVNDGSQEARNPKSGFETRSACRDDLDSACANAGDEWERAHTSCQLGSGGLVATNYDTSGQKRPRKRGEGERGVERGGVGVGVERDPDSLSRDSRRETLQNCCRAATERLSADRSSPPRQVSQQSSPKQASEGDESDESLHRTASECKSSMDRGRTNECKTCITSHHADSPS